MKETLSNFSTVNLLNNPLIKNGRNSILHQLSGGININEQSIHIVGLRQSNISYRNLSYNNSIIYTNYDTGDNTWGVAIDPQGYVIIGRAGGLIKLEPISNRIIWTISIAASNCGVHVDHLGFIYIASNRVSNLTTRKFSPDGVLLFALDHGANIQKITTDEYGNIYTVGNRTGPTTTLRKYDQNGTLLWSADHGADARALAIDKQGNVYQGGLVVNTGSGDATTRKYTSNGELIWSVNHQNTVRHIEVDDLGNVYTCGDDVISGTVLNVSKRKYDKDGNLLWSVIDSQETYWFKLLNDGTAIYAGENMATGELTGSSIHKRSTINGQLIRGYSFAHGNYNTWAAIGS